MLGSDPADGLLRFKIRPVPGFLLTLSFFYVARHTRPV
jgi:hypothetical protein